MELFPNEGENIGTACEETHMSSLRSMKSSEANPSVPSISSSSLTVGQTDDSTALSLHEKTSIAIMRLLNPVTLPNSNFIKLIEYNNSLSISMLTSSMPLQHLSMSLLHIKKQNLILFGSRL